MRAAADALFRRVDVWLCPCTLLAPFDKVPAHALHMHCMGIAHALHMHSMGIAHALHMLCMGIAHALHMHCTCTAHALHMHCTCTAWALYMHCMGIARALHGHCMGTARAQLAAPLRLKVVPPLRHWALGKALRLTLHSVTLYLLTICIPGALYLGHSDALRSCVTRQRCRTRHNLSSGITSPGCCRARRSRCSISPQSQSPPATPRVGCAPEW